jgi:hypothetical protein
MTHICSQCYKQFKTKNDLTRHKNKKFKCKPIEEQINENTDISTLINIIKYKCKEVQQKDEIIKQHNNVNYHTPTQTINNTTNNINKGTVNKIKTINNINITLPFGQEKTDHFTVDQLNNIFKRCMKCAVFSVKLKHFNPENPENHNVFISNLRDEYAQVFNGDKWMIDNKDDVIQQLYDDNVEFLIGKYSEMKSKKELNELSIKKFDRFMTMKDNESTINTAKKDIKKVLYNNRDIVNKS